MGYRQVTSTGSCQYREDGGLEARVIGNIKLTRLPRLSVLAYAIFGAHFCAVFVFVFLFLVFLVRLRLLALPRVAGRLGVCVI